MDRSSLTATARTQPAASSQQPTASSQQPAASSLQPAATPMELQSHTDDSESASVSYTPSQVLKMREFWLMWFCYFFNMLSVNFAMNNVKVFGQSQGVGMNDHSLSAVASASALFNGIGRLAWGYIGDRRSFRVAIMQMSNLKAISLLTFNSSAKAGSFSYLLSVALMFFCVGGISSIWAAAANKYFGAAHFGRNFGLLTIAGGLGWTVGAAFFQFAQKNFSNDAVAFYTGLFSVMASVLAMMLRETHDFWEANSRHYD